MKIDFRLYPGFLSADNLDELRDQMVKTWGVGPGSHWYRELTAEILYTPGDHLKERIRHQHNDHGFRDDEITLEPDICYYGCSFTFADGVHVKDRWSNCVDRAMGFKSNNFGVQGMTTEGVCDMFVVTSKLIKIPRAVILWPDWFRYQMPFVNGNEYNYLTIFPHEDYRTPTIFPWDLMVKDLFPYYNSLSDEHFSYKFKNSVNMVMHIAEMNGTEVWMSTWSDDSRTWKILENSGCRLVPRFVNDGLAADMAHPGPKAHARFAKQVVDYMRTHA